MGHMINGGKMNIFNRLILAERLPRAFTNFIKIFPHIFIVKNPFYMLYHYIKKDSPEFIDLKSGHRILLSSHPHDIVTFFVIFLRKDYGDIEKNDIVIDVGANIGIFSIFAALSGAKKVYAFEPSKESFDVLCENIEINNLTDIIIPINRAVSSKDNEIIKFSISSSPYNKITVCDAVDNDKYHKIQTVTLGSFIISNSIDHVDLLKLDCEGAEFDILPSMDKDVLSMVRKIRMEFHSKPDELVVDLCQQGFVVDKINGNDLWLKNNLNNYV